jgi:hypothetical protein
MNRKKVILLTLVLVLVIAIGAVASAGGEALNVRWNSGLGGGSGGGVSNSAGFHLIGSEMGAISVSSTSASYQMCAGFLCLDVRAVYLPLVVR